MLRRVIVKTVGTGMACLGLAMTACAAPPEVIRALSFRPLQKNVIYTQPVEADIEKCRMEPFRGKEGRKGSGWVLKDGRGQILRRFVDNNGDNYTDQWSYYLDGNEVYREVDSNFNGKADLFYWLRPAGSRIGQDRNEDGVIDRWLVLSPEELGQEVVRALAAKDFRIMQPLLLDDQDVQALGGAEKLPQLKPALEQHREKFQKVCGLLAHWNESARWVHSELPLPTRVARETLELPQDLIIYSRSIILCEADGKSEWLQTAELIRVGDAWKLTTIPVPGGSDLPVGPSVQETTAGRDPVPPALRPLLDELAQLDERAPLHGAQSGQQTVRYYLQRAAILEKILAQAPAAEQETWLRQLVDTWSGAVQAGAPGERLALDKLAALAKQIGQQFPNSPLAAYAQYRLLSANYTQAVAQVDKPDAIVALQNKWIEQLKAFVEQYPNAGETAEALWQLGMLCEFQNKEAEAKKWYSQLLASFPRSQQAGKAAGALKRLNLEGQAWELDPRLPLLALAGPAFSLDRLRGRPFIVYYWATWCQSAADDFVRLRRILEAQPQLQLLAINVDEDQADAEAFVRKHNPPGYQLYAGGGLDGPVATAYGLFAFPEMFLVGPDGKVISKSLHLSTVEEELKKLGGASKPR